MARVPRSTIGRTALVVVTVIAVIAAIGLIAAGVSYLVHHHDRGRSPVVTVQESH